ncbi:RDD family protein [Allonocardiopsis opalescens]|uniref:RDD family protein n=1 Tax=Allonocardiopsis opalescens TaxID=1144618 RepID=A0A2T0QCH1_9ACTN|nr:RDD family protein [Allonocardiopsis opalescens]PRY01598.1 RDD family protein [Allonocardiopsis opalescens]
MGVVTAGWVDAESARAALVLLGGAFALVLGALAHLANEYRRYGRMTAWAAVVNTLMIGYAAGLGAFAVLGAPVPAGCAAAPVPPLVLLSGDAAQLGIAATAFAPLGFFARYRFRRGIALSALLAAAAALAVEGLRLAAAFGALPCPVPAAADRPLAAALGAAAGWLLARLLTRVLPRGWPSAIVDVRPPGLWRRAAGHLLDAALCWLGAQLVAVALLAARPSAGADGEVAGLALTVAVALVLVPLVRRDRCSPGRAALHLAVVRTATWRPCGSVAVLVRLLVFQLPLLLAATASSGWALPLPAGYALVAQLHPGGRGLAGLLSGTRTQTRAAVLGGLPTRLRMAARAPVGATRTEVAEAPGQGARPPSAA